MDKKNTAAKIVNLVLGILVLAAVVLLSPVFGYGKGLTTREERAEMKTTITRPTDDYYLYKAKETPIPTPEPTPEMSVLPSAPPAPTETPRPTSRPSAASVQQMQTVQTYQEQNYGQTAVQETAVQQTAAEPAYSYTEDYYYDDSYAEPAAEDTAAESTADAYEYAGIGEQPVENESGNFVVNTAEADIVFQNPVTDNTQTTTTTTVVTQEETAVVQPDIVFNTNTGAFTADANEGEAFLIG